ncbi:MAG: phosphate ABC transporter permease subunit PstC [Acidimicrobiales bacterium]
MSRNLADRIFRGLATGSGLGVLALIGAIVAFLVAQGWPALQRIGVVEFVTRSCWRTQVSHPCYGIGNALVGSLLIAGVAITLAIPISLGTALTINEYAPARLRPVLTALVDLLAAVPSLIFGFWGFFFLQPHLLGVSRWLASHGGSIPIFRVGATPDFTQSMFIAGMVVGVMAIPIVTSISREVMAQVPRDLCEAAYALGGTRWAMIRDVLLPFARGGIVGAALLGLGRALGETVAVTLLLSELDRLSVRVLQGGGSSVPALILNKFGEGGPLGQSALIAAGLALFVVTLAVNLIARRVVLRSAPDLGAR